MKTKYKSYHCDDNASHIIVMTMLVCILCFFIIKKLSSLLFVHIYKPFQICTKMKVSIWTIALHRSYSPLDIEKAPSIIFYSLLWHVTSIIRLIKNKKNHMGTKCINIIRNTRSLSFLLNPWLSKYRNSTTRKNVLPSSQIYS